MTPLSSSTFGRPRRPPRRGPLIAVAIATVIIVPFVIRDMVNGDQPVSARGASPTTVTTAGAGAVPTTAAPTTTVPGEKAPPQQVQLDPGWVAKGWSRYSDSDEETQSRINHNNMLGTTVPPPTTVPKTPTTLKGDKTGPTTTVKVPRTTVAPAVSAPTAPRSTATPATDPPTTTPPATAPPRPVTAPPVEPPPAALVQPTVGSGG